MGISAFAHLDDELVVGFQGVNLLVNLGDGHTVPVCCRFSQEAKFPPVLIMLIQTPSSMPLVPIVSIK